MINDLVSDALTRIRNAGMRRLDVTTLVHSKSIEAMANILVEKGYIESSNVVEDGVKKTINVVLKYGENGKSVINEMKRISKPGRRVYKGKEEIKRFKNGYGTIIVSTSHGILPNDKAFQLGVGGEVMCTIW
ncbi:MAG: 30S ribosomal protein S8 [Sulfurimonas sp. RIFCSPHIGHO2_12_FULL_36_9]|jgi:small subunit ribosomal protein S8|uniref:30S ribosomal protein S8 n=1 Tax=unclassified Sulfurimonas TaxID=2623549 RepID=UPI0008B46BEA|nr:MULTISPECIES: 30S ribosomal protein S8 [unclassified Sulfurimonas]OHD97147.1 MAG: 30S ribosomal protein S8 [Sulfurimonas sp. RIFCSPLOWO2_02_FULL_36_28]OHD97384.1 MAG: 30S ribosomal protein S8 [Sulfurimonas sp. RIFCSPHIGHO2_12_FULL_36_9]OHE01718.1 MAG: 30S ribosomal protein S8 [Sulfurimonas sp. RIFCSPLOWO2_12_36_12]OHE08018.1 MAG: 30S ribosomal protein S8 [Sulfurimonas sp. RIFCSPLOWO2_12_FULL_36_74]